MLGQTSYELFNAVEHIRIDKIDTDKIDGNKDMLEDARGFEGHLL